MNSWQGYVPEQTPEISMFNLLICVKYSVHEQGYLGFVQSRFATATGILYSGFRYGFECAGDLINDAGNTDTFGTLGAGAAYGAGAGAGGA